MASFLHKLESFVEKAADIVHEVQKGAHLGGDSSSHQHQQQQQQHTQQQQQQQQQPFGQPTSSGPNPYGNQPVYAPATANPSPPNPTHHAQPSAWDHSLPVHQSDNQPHPHQHLQQQQQAHHQQPEPQPTGPSPAHGPVPDPTPEELRDLSAAAQRIWDLDSCRWMPGRDFQLNLQNKTCVSGTSDAAREPLFKYIDVNKFKQTPSFDLFYFLLNAYNPVDGVKDAITPEIASAERRFIDEIAKTAPIIYLHKYLAARGLCDRSMEGFKQELHKIWFEPYRRVVDDDSSSFQHTFVGEIRADRDTNCLKVVGFHNWIKFVLEERQGRADYRGFILPKSRKGRGNNPTGEEHVLCIQLSWMGEIKNVSSFFIGTSPECEVALFTLCFKAGQEDTPTRIVVDDVDCAVTVKKYHSQRKGDKIGSAFVEVI
ncbi:Endoribonuclease XendoU-domain-containing protein [Zopfochytrium polystomum]|nr:Endoribonuclease XendoU-domain-containing protein [Zopfochytrium polystomum]